MKDCLVSIVLVIYNNANDLKECLDSLMAQDYSSYEIIAVDNGSIDNSPDIIRLNYPDVTLILAGKNLGYAAGNNLGLAHADGKYIVILNPDTVVERNWLTELINPLEKDKDIGMTTSRILLYSDRDRINTCGNSSHFTGLGFCVGLNEPASRFASPFDANAISGCSFAIRKDLFQKLNGFDEDFFLYCEDVDLSWRVRLAGYKIRFTPSSIVYHKYRLSLAPWKEYYLERNRYLILLKNYRLRTLLLIFPALVVTEILTWFQAALYGLPYVKSKLTAYVWLMRNLNKILEKRRATQAMRIISDNDLIMSLDWYIPFEQLLKNKLLVSLAGGIFNTFYKFNLQLAKIFT